MNISSEHTYAGMNSYVRTWQQWMACLAGSLPQRKSLVLELTVKQQALLYITVLGNKAVHKASHLLTLSLASVCLFVWLYTSMHASLYCVCVHFQEYLFRRICEESACRDVSGGLRYSACCQHRNISPSAPLHRYANPASSECRAPDQLQFIPFGSLPLDILALPPFLSVLSALYPPLLLFLLLPPCLLFSIWAYLLWWEVRGFLLSSLKPKLTTKNCYLLSVVHKVQEVKNCLCVCTYLNILLPVSVCDLFFALSQFVCIVPMRQSISLSLVHY